MAREIEEREIFDRPIKAGRRGEGRSEGWLDAINLAPLKTLSYARPCGPVEFSEREPARRSSCEGSGIRCVS
jgi:hypothetical protein